jgi:hypothetical protein
MPAIDSSFVIMPRFTTLVGQATFTTMPMDVSAYGGAQFQVWRGPFRVSDGGVGTLNVYLEESLDTQTWVTGPSTPAAYPVNPFETKFFSYDFRLRWFRLRIVTTGANPIVTCWAEGLLRGGGGGLWQWDQGPTIPAGAIGADWRSGTGGGGRAWGYEDMLAFSQSQSADSYNRARYRYGKSGTTDGAGGSSGGVSLTKT